MTTAENENTKAELDGVNGLSELDRGLYRYYEHLMDKKSTEAVAKLHVLEQETKRAGEEFIYSFSKRTQAQEQLNTAQAKFSLAHAHYVRAGEMENSAADALQKAKTKPGARFKPTLQGFRDLKAAVMELETLK